LASRLLFATRVLTALHSLRPWFLLAFAPLALFGGTLVPHAERATPHRYFSALEMLHRVTCEQSADYQTFQVGVAQRDAWGNRYVFECNARGFTIVSAGPDGRPDTADDLRSDQ